jgi:hypothetical protein
MPASRHAEKLVASCLKQKGKTTQILDRSTGEYSLNILKNGEWVRGYDQDNEMRKDTT